MPSFIDCFLHDGVSYRHVIYCNEDDRVECLDEDENVILTFTADCRVIAVGKIIGRFSMQYDKWMFLSNSGAVLMFGTDVLRAEVAVSKLYLRGEFDEQPC